MRLLTGWFEKMRGLLGTRVDAEPVILAGCGSIHTVGMRYPIDVAFVSERGEVLRTCRKVWPGRFVSCHGARAVVERPASDEPWVRAGDRLVLWSAPPHGCVPQGPSSLLAGTGSSSRPPASSPRHLRRDVRTRDAQACARG